MPDNSRSTTFAGRKVPAGITASPEQTVTAESEWSLEDMAQAEPYPVPEVTPEMVQQFLQAAAPASTTGGSTSPGGLPGEGAEAKDTEPTAGHAYPPPFTSTKSSFLTRRTLT